MITTLQKDTIGSILRSLDSNLASKKRLRYLGLVSSVLIVVGSLSPSVPFTSKAVGAWFIGVPGSLFTLWFIPDVISQILYYVGFILGIVVWVAVVRQVIEKQYTTKELLLLASVWFVPLLLAGPLYSKDIYSYAAIGEMVSRHISPYLYGPNILGATPYLNTVDPFWGNAPAPYGPAFLWFAGTMAVLSQHNPVFTMVLLRVSAIIAVVVITVCAMWLANASGRDKNLTLVLVGLNPLVVFHLASSGHNDAYMLAFLALGLIALRKNYRILSVVLISVGASVKIPVILGVAFVAWTSNPDSAIRAKIKPMFFYGLVSIATLALISIVTGIGWGWLSNLGTPGIIRSAAVPTTIFANWSYRITSLVGFPLQIGGWLTLFRALGLLLAGATGLFFVWKCEKYTIEKSIGYSLLALVLFGPVIQPWYIVWGLVFLAIRPSTRVITGIVVVSVAGMLLGLPDGPTLVSWTGYLTLISAGLVLAANRIGIRVLPGSLHDVFFQKNHAVSATAQIS